MKQIIFLSFACAIFLASCGSNEGPKKTLESEIIEQHLSDNSLSFSITSEGVYQYVITSNPGGNSSGDVFSIYYTLTNLETSEIIDSYLVGDGDPVKLKHNSSAVFPRGLDFGLSGVLEGETYGIILPVSLGFGDFTASSVPLGTILQFEVEVVTRETESDIATEEGDGIAAYIAANNLDDLILNPVDAVVALNNGIYYKRTGAGDGTPLISGDSITINYNGFLLDGSSFDNLSAFKYKFGSGTVISGFDIGVGEMEQGERATIFVPSAQAYGASVRVIPESSIGDLISQFVVPDYAARVKPYEVLVFDVTLQTIH